MTSPEISSEVHAAGPWPNKVTIFRRARVSIDLSRITWRQVVAIKVYKGDNDVLSLSVDQAKELSESLATAVEQASHGLLGDLE